MPRKIGREKNRRRRGTSFRKEDPARIAGKQQREEYRGNAAKEDKQVKELTVEATFDNIPVVTDFVETELEALECPLKARMQIDVAIDELISNIARYAYKPDVGPVTIQVDVRDASTVVITFIDNGKPYDPLAKEDPNTTLSAAEREIGGLGIFVVKKTMDDVSYEYKNGQNILRIKKNL